MIHGHFIGLETPGKTKLEIFSTIWAFFRYILRGNEAPKVDITGANSHAAPRLRLAKRSLYKGEGGNQ